MLQRERDVTFDLNYGRVGVEHPRGGKLYLIVQTADTRTFFQLDFGATLFLNLFAHNSAPFRGWILNRQKRKISLPYWGTTIFLFSEKSNENADFP